MKPEPSLNRFLEGRIGYYLEYGKTMERHYCPVERLDELFWEMLWFLKDSYVN